MFVVVKLLLYNISWCYLLSSIDALFQSNAKRCPNQEKTLIIWVLTTSTDSWNTQLGAGIDVSYLLININK